MSIYTQKLQTVVQLIQNALSEMTPRDRKLLLGMVVAASLAVTVGVASWMSSSLSRLDDTLTQREQTLGTIEVLLAEHSEASESKDAIEQQLQEHGSTDLSAYIEQAAGKINIRERLTSVREKSTKSDDFLEERSYSISLNRLTLDEMSSFLYEIEANGYPLQVKTFKARAKKRGDDKLLDVDMDVSSFKVILDEEEVQG